jgi:hypothetical protein
VTGAEHEHAGGERPHDLDGEVEADSLVDDFRHGDGGHGESDPAGKDGQ